jgi:predicted DNA-binding protein (MmcQ/YjbR family)
VGAKPSLTRIGATLRAAALAYPDAREEFPWGESAFKVKGKVFLFFGADAKELGLSVKIPRSAMAALMMPFAFPTPYNLGKSGWVSAKFGARDKVPVELLLSWIDESYREIAPKTLVATLSPVEQRSRKR